MSDILTPQDEGIVERLKRLATRGEIVEVVFKDEETQKGKLEFDEFKKNIFLWFVLEDLKFKVVASLGEKEELFFNQLTILRDDVRDRISREIKNEEDIFRCVSFF